MADRLTAPQRSALMSRVKQKNTRPEVTLRSALHRLGFRFRLGVPKLPGRPDIVFPGRKKVVFVHGCFWHGHSCPRGKLPTTNRSFWENKISGNKLRDARAIRELRRMGWGTAVAWECQLRDMEKLTGKLALFLEAESKWRRSSPKNL